MSIIEKLKTIIQNIIKRLLIIGIALFCSISTYGQVTARASIDTSTILIGQQVNLKLNVNLPKNQSVIWPYFSDSLATGVEIVQSSKIDTVLSTDQKSFSLTQRLRITSFDTGFHKIPVIPFYTKGVGDSLQLLAATSELFLTVNTIPVDTTKVFKDIKGVMSPPLSFWEVFRWVLLGLVVAGIAFGIWYYLKKRRQNQPVFVLPSKPPVPPYIIALEELEKLRQSKLWQTGKVKEYHTQLTDILRVYLEKKYQILAMEMTTWEIMESMRSYQVNPEAKRLLQEVLELADLVKFAKEQPLPVQHDHNLKLAVDFVNLTILSGEENKDEQPLVAAPENKSEAL
ncbi:MAG: hypothetical protein NTU44_02630 [Bacteroidetes bacterium]|nr:hypothetical protein [Bacteroidota bacterium]